jgi:hypothetical protein
MSKDSSDALPRHSTHGSLAKVAIPENTEFAVTVASVRRQFHREANN